jgi:hypothetical protein
MDRKNVFVCVLGMALMLGFAGIASAQEEDTTQQVDWDDAVNYAELMDTWVNDDSIEMNTYYDDAQNVLWSQPADLPIEAAAKAFAVGPKYAETLLITQWVVPMSLWLCDNDKDDDSSCTSGTNYKWTTAGDFYLVEVISPTAYYVTDYSPCVMSSIERVRSQGGSSTTNYCDDAGSDYDGYYAHGDGAFHAAAGDEEWCSYPFGYYYYYVDDSDDISGETYTEYNPTNIVKFRYKSGGTFYYTLVTFMGCLE